MLPPPQRRRRRRRPATHPRPSSPRRRRRRRRRKGRRGRGRRRGPGFTSFSRFTLTNLPQGSPLHWFAFAFVYLSTFWTLFCCGDTTGREFGRRFRRSRSWFFLFLLPRFSASTAATTERGGKTHQSYSHHFSSQKKLFPKTLDDQLRPPATEVRHGRRSPVVCLARGLFGEGGAGGRGGREGAGGGEFCCRGEEEARTRTGGRSRCCCCCRRCLRSSRRSSSAARLSGFPRREGQRQEEKRRARAALERRSSPPLREGRERRRGSGSGSGAPRLP